MPEVIGLAQQLNGAVKAIAFGPVARTDDPESRQGRLPSFGAHVDYGRRTIDDITRDLLGQEADHWLCEARRADEFLATDHAGVQLAARAVRRLDGAGLGPARQRGPRRPDGREPATAVTATT